MSTHVASSYSNESSHGSGVQNLFTESQSWYSGNHPEKSNPLKAIVNIADNTVIQWVLKTTTGYVADILDPAWTAVKNAGSIFSLEAWKKHGAKTIPKAVWGTATNAWKAVTNSLTGLTRGADKVYTNVITDNITDVSSGTVDRVPWFGGKFVGNAIKGVNAFPAAFVRTLGNFLPKKIIDEMVDWMAWWGIHQSGKRRVDTESEWHGHGGAHH
jgi:hypothetical protein